MVREGSFRGDDFYIHQSQNAYVITEEEEEEEEEEELERAGTALITSNLLVASCSSNSSILLTVYTTVSTGISYLRGQVRQLERNQQRQLLSQPPQTKKRPARRPLQQSTLAKAQKKQ
jgi:hypothetical protein